ncbi:hypothetical protein [Anaerobiospirillum succiniciproducens]|uniref:hypothetical protein n=1 Tax=Anaerobiospirillum succiniciproducens TaxID=13335 RepID=UPI0023557C05|nr:hypothetical protein [Anaerobiospirillum succiniciproducens]MCI6864316.1 hypothetical protein [Anaerobiospirillum succiniciproducens]
MNQSIFEQQDILDKLFLQLKRDYQEGKTSEYNSLVSIAPTMTKDEYEQMIERFTAYMRGKEIDALNEHEVKLRSALPFLPENMNTGLLGIELELLKHLNAFIVKRDQRVADAVQDAFKALQDQNAQLQKELDRTQEALAKSNHDLEALRASLNDVKQDGLFKQQVMENMSMSVDILDLLQCLNSGEQQLSVEGLPVNLKLREDMNDLLSRAKSLSAAERAALSGMIFKAGDLVKTAKALGYSVADLKQNADGQSINPLKQENDATAKSVDEYLSESSKALGSVPPLPEEFRHLEQLGADDSYSDEFESGDDDVGVSFAKVAAALAAASGTKKTADKNALPKSLQAKLGDRVDILSRIGRGTADNMSELISAMQGSEGNVIARRLEARQARRDASMAASDSTTEAQNFKAAELATLVQERTSTHAERIAAQSCLNALASGDEDESRSTRESISGPIALAGKIGARVSAENSKVVDTALLFGQVSALVEDLLKQKSVDEIKPQDIEKLITDARSNSSISRYEPALLRRLILKSIFVGPQYLVAADLRENDVDLLVSLPTEKARAFARTSIELGNSFSDLLSESKKNTSDSDGDRPTQGSAISALISGVDSDKKALFVDSKQSTNQETEQSTQDSELANKSLAQRVSQASDIANVGAALRSEIEGIKNRFDAAFEGLNTKSTSVINAKPTSVINSSNPKALPREERTLVRTMAAERDNDNVAAFAEASAKIEKLAPLLHEAGKEIAKARKEFENAIADSKQKEEQARLNEKYTPTSKKLSLGSNGAFSFGKGALEDSEKEETSTATDEIASVAKDVVKVAYALEEASYHKRERKQSLFGGNTQGVTVFGADTHSFDDELSPSESSKLSDKDNSFIADGEDLSDFVTGNINDIKPMKDDALKVEAYKEDQDFQIKHHMDPYEQARLNQGTNAQVVQTSLSKNTNIVKDSGSSSDSRISNTFDFGSTSFNFGAQIQPKLSSTERGPVQKAADQLKDVLSAALAAGKNKLSNESKDGVINTETTSIVKNSAPPLAVDPTGRVMDAQELRKKQQLYEFKLKGDGPSTLITKADSSAEAQEKSQDKIEDKIEAQSQEKLEDKALDKSEDKSEDKSAADAPKSSSLDEEQGKDDSKIANDASTDASDDAVNTKSVDEQSKGASNDESNDATTDASEEAVDTKSVDEQSKDESSDEKDVGDLPSDVSRVDLAMLEAAFEQAESDKAEADKAESEKAQADKDEADKAASDKADTDKHSEANEEKSEAQEDKSEDSVDKSADASCENKDGSKDEDALEDKQSTSSNIFSTPSSFNSSTAPFAVMIDPAKQFVVKTKLKDDEKRTLGMVSSMLENKVNSHIKMVKDTLSSAGSLSSFRFADFTSYYRQCIDNLESDGYVNAALKRILVDKMSFDLKHETISKLTFKSDLKNNHGKSGSVASNEDDTNLSPSNDAKSEESQLTADKSDESDKNHAKEPGFVILDKADASDGKDEQPSSSKGGIASFVTNLFSSQKSDKNQSSHKDTGFFIVKDSDKEGKDDK